MIRRAALALAIVSASGWGAHAGRVAWPGALEAEGRALLSYPDGERADSTARFVSRFGASAAAPWLRPLLDAGPAPLRLLAARTLVRIGDPAGRATALKWLTGPSSAPGDRALGLDALSWDPAAPALPDVREAVEQAARDRDALMRAEALDALGRMDAAETGRLSPSLPVILSCLDDLDREVRVRAVRLVLRAAETDPGGAAAAAPLLLERLDDGDRLVRVTALRALGALRDPRMVPALLRIAAAEPSDLQAAAADALGWPGAGAAVPFLAGLLHRRPGDTEARHAARALGHIASAEAVAALVAALRTAPVPDEIGRGLIDAGPAAVGPLLRAVEGSDLGSAARAIPLLAELGDRRAVPPLGRAARRRGGPLALVAIEALARLRAPDAVPSLAEATEGPDPEVRRAALDALAALGDARAAAAAERGLGDADATVRAGAARLAERLGSAAPAAALAERLGDDDAAVRVAAAQALATLGTAASPGLLARALAATARAPSGGWAPGDVAAFAALLQSLATVAEAPRLDAALLAGGDVRILAGALVAAHRDTPIADHAVLARLVVDLAGAPPQAGAAALALAAAHLEVDDRARLARVLADAEPAVRAAACAAVARLPDGHRWLAAWMSRAEPVELRAAAAWAARDQPALADTLRALAEAPDEPVAINARAALAGSARTPGHLPLSARLTDVDGVPLAGRWVLVSAGALSVAARTDGTGAVRLTGLPDAPATLVPLPRPGGEL